MNFKQTAHVRSLQPQLRLSRPAAVVSLRLALSAWACLSLLGCVPRRPSTPTPLATAPLVSLPITPTAAGGQVRLTPLVSSPITPTPAGAQVQLTPLGSSPISPTPAGAQVRLIGTYVPPLQVIAQCQAMASYGARFTWTAIPWDAIEPYKGTFTWKKADPILFAMRACGFDIGVHILSRHAGGWATQPTPNIPNAKNASMPPKNLDEYYDFVFQLANHYKGIVGRYSIENEAHASSNWPASPEEYFKVLATAYRAIKAADPNALVEDSALSSSALGVLMTNDLLKAGKTDEAVAYLHRYYANFAPRVGKGEPIVVDKVEDVNNLLANPEVQRLLTWVPLLFANHDYFDVEQLHYFGPWDDLPGVMQWVHNQLKAQGADKPIDLWEMGYAWDNVSTYDPLAHARDEPKYLAVAMGEGGERVLSWLFTDLAFEAQGHPGLTTAQGPRPAAQSFRVTATKLNGTQKSERLDLGPEVWGYRFDKPDGSVYVIWSTQPGQVSLPINAQSVTVTDITGQATTADPKALAVGDSPIFVESK